MRRRLLSRIENRVAEMKARGEKLRDDDNPEVLHKRLDAYRATDCAADRLLPPARHAALGQRHGADRRRHRAIDEVLAGRCSPPSKKRVQRLRRESRPAAPPVRPKAARACQSRPRRLEPQALPQRTVPQRKNRKKIQEDEQRPPQTNQDCRQNLPPAQNRGGQIGRFGQNQENGAPLTSFVHEFAS